MGYPIGDTIDDCIGTKVSALKMMENRIQYLQAHDALLLLRYSLSILRLVYLRRTVLCFLSLQLSVFDDIFKRMLGLVMNICFSSEESIWLQASLPVRFGGLGIPRAVQLALSAFQSSVASSALIHQIL